MSDGTPGFAVAAGLSWLWTLAAVAGTALLVACAGDGADGDASPPPAGETPRGEGTRALPRSEMVGLPPPRLESAMPLEQALAIRRSVRDYTEQELTPAQLGQLLWAAQGVTAEWGGRTAPSAGALYPLEVYAATSSGLFHYVPDGHRLEQQAPDDVREALAAAGLGQEALEEAPVILAVTAIPERPPERYGERSERHALLEAGHAVQNVLLQAVALGLGAVPIGAFEDAAVADALAVAPAEEPVYLVAVGHPEPE